MSGKDGGAGPDDNPAGADEGAGNGSDGAAGADVLSFTGDDGATLDAFDEAVNRAFEAKVGQGPDATPGADELVANVLSALTGKDAADALATVRKELDKQRPPEEGAEPLKNVIDLAAARRARDQPASELTQKIGSVLRESFQDFMGDYAGRSSSASVSVDARFLREEGPALLGKLFSGLADAFTTTVGKEVGAVAETTADADGAPASEEDTPTEVQSTDGGDPNTPIQVKLDLASLLSGLFGRRK